MKCISSRSTKSESAVFSKICLFGVAGVVALSTIIAPIGAYADTEAGQNRRIDKLSAKSKRLDKSISSLGAKLTDFQNKVNLAAVKGEKGDTGATGPKGDTGPAGNPLREALFGGMYGDYPSADYSNPLAGNKRECPTGYKAFEVLGSAGVDYGAFVCLGVPGQVAKIAEYGGVYSTTQNNPITGAKNCPPGYTNRQVVGSPVDANMFFCYAAVGSAAPVVEAFGGMWGSSGNTGASQLGYYANPVSGGRCFFDYTEAQVFGQPGDYGIYECHK